MLVLGSQLRYVDLTSNNLSISNSESFFDFFSRCVTEHELVSQFFEPKEVSFDVILSENKVKTAFDADVVFSLVKANPELDAFWRLQDIQR